MQIKVVQICGGDNSKYKLVRGDINGQNMWIWRTVTTYKRLLKHNWNLLQN